MLGPARFNHIEVCTKEACQAFKAIEEVEECIGQLRDLDEELARLRAELAASTAPGPAGASDEPGSSQSSSKAPDYAPLLVARDVAKAKRLVNARRNAIKGVKSLITANQKAATAEPSAT